MVPTVQRKVCSLEKKVQTVNKNVQTVHKKIQTVHEKVQTVHKKVLRELNIHSLDVGMIHLYVTKVTYNKKGGPTSTE